MSAETLRVVWQQASLPQVQVQVWHLQPDALAAACPAQQLEQRLTGKQQHTCCWGTSRASMLGKGWPTVPGRRSPCRGLESSIPVSVMP